MLTTLSPSIGVGVLKKILYSFFFYFFLIVVFGVLLNIVSFDLLPEDDAHDPSW